MTSGIYRIDLGNDWFYIGSAVNLKRREREHRYKLNCRNHHSQKMQNCFNKYGVFEFTILEHCFVDELINLEQIHLDKHFDNPKNVNLAPTAGSCLGVIRSVETRAKISAARKGKVLSADAREKLSAVNKKRVFSAEHRAKISAAKKGTVFSVQHRAKLSEANKRKVVSAETKQRMSKAKKSYWAARKAQAA